jgi:hypothetical protein
MTTRLHGVTSQKTAVFIFTAVRTSNFVVSLNLAEHEKREFLVSDFERYVYIAMK